MAPSLIISTLPCNIRRSSHLSLQSHFTLPSYRHILNVGINIWDVNWLDHEVVAEERGKKKEGKKQDTQQAQQFRFEEK